MKNIYIISILRRTITVFLILLLCQIPNIKNCTASQSKILLASFYSVASLKAEGTYKTSKGVMANGKLFNELDTTCACNLYPIGTTLRVTVLDTGKSVVVKVTDRIGKRFAKTRIDLSKLAFSRIAELRQGIVKVEVTPI